MLVLNSPPVLPLSKNFHLQDSVSAHIMRVVVAGSEWGRASVSHQQGGPQGLSSSLGSSWHETNFHILSLSNPGNAEHQMY